MPDAELPSGLIETAGYFVPMIDPHMGRTESQARSQLGTWDLGRRQVPVRHCGQHPSFLSAGLWLEGPAEVNASRRLGSSKSGLCIVAKHGDCFVSFRHVSCKNVERMQHAGEVLLFDW